MSITSSKISDPAEFLGRSYSTAEADTGKTWLNGKTIYQKVVYRSALPNVGTGSYAHGITTIDFLVDLRGIADPGSGNQIPFPRATGTTNYIDLYANTTNFTIGTGTNLSTWSAYIFFEYTKA